MGCVASKLEEEEVVSICRERKRHIKLAVERRYALAEAHSKYCQALYAVSAAIKLFVARHSSPSPFLITFPPTCSSSSPPPSEKVISNPMFLQQRPSDSTHEAIPACPSCACSSSSTSTESSMEEREEEPVEEERIEQFPAYFYMQMPPPMPSPQREFSWDFFNPFDTMRTDVVGGFRQSSEEEEGIPELEEETVEKNQRVEDVGEKEEENQLKKGLKVIDTPVEGRELLEALQDVEDYFIRAYDSGIEVSRMLEANKIQLQSGLEEIKGVPFI